MYFFLNYLPSIVLELLARTIFGVVFRELEEVSALLFWSIVDWKIEQLSILICKLSI